MKLKFVVVVGVFALLIFTPQHLSAAFLSPGDILVANIGRNSEGGFPLGIVKVDPTTGDRTVVSGSGVGGGPSFEEPFGVLATPGGDIYVTGGFSDSVFRVDPTTGIRTIVSGPGEGSGPAFDTALDLALGADNSLIVTTAFTHRDAGMGIGDVFRVDLATGDRKTLSSSFLGIGTGPDLFEPASVAIDANGQILVSDSARILGIDPITGNRMLLSGNGIGVGTDFSSAAGIALEENGNLLVADVVQDVIFRVNSTTGDRTFVSGGGIGGGPDLQSPFALAVHADGTIFAMDAGSDALYSINPTTGDRTLLSGNGAGLGPDFSTPAFIAVVPVPEPASVVIFLSGLFCLMAWKYADRKMNRA